VDSAAVLERIVRERPVSVLFRDIVPFSAAYTVFHDRPQTQKRLFPAVFAELPEKALF
jgi:hypothetical protein